jgi:hypothetical protein
MSERPDIVVVPSGEENCVYFVANQKARRIFNAGFERPRPVWRKTAGAEFSSPAYRSIELERGACLAAMLWHAHEVGLQAMFWCDEHQELHLVDDDHAAQFRFIAVSGAADTLPGPEGVQ